MHKVGDVLPDGRQIVGVDPSLRRYAADGSVESSGVEYRFAIEGAEGKFQVWGESNAEGQ